MVEFDQSEMEQFAEFHASRAEVTNLTRWQRLKLVKLSTILFLALSGIALILAVAFLLMPILVTVLSSLGVDLTSSGLVAWALNGSNNLIGAGVFGVVGIGLFVLARQRLLDNPYLWINEGCPRCREHDLIRIQRQRSDRMLSLALPVRRFACRNCTWEGRRFGRDNANIPSVEDADKPDTIADSAE